MKNNLKNKLNLLASKQAVTRLAAAVLIIAVIASFTVAAGGIYYLLAVANSSQITTSPTATPTSKPTPTPSSVSPPTSTPTLPPTCPPSSTPKPSVTSTPTSPPAPTPNPTPQPTPNPTPQPTPQPTPTPVPYPKYSLSEAISAGYVESNITGMGYSSGISIILNVRRLVNYTIEIEPLPAGTLLVTSSNSQNMVVSRLYGIIVGMTNYSISYYLRDRMMLDSSNVSQYLYIAYCVNFHKSNPTYSTSYTMSGTADPNVVKILNVASSNQLPSNVTSTGAIQAAISVVTDNPSRSEFQSIWPSYVAEIPNAKTILDTAGIDTSKALLFT